MIAEAKEKETAEKVQTVPEGYTTVTPFILVKGAAKLLDFLKDAFGAKELSRMTGEDGAITHAEAKIGDAIVMMFDAKREWPETPSFLRLYVKDNEVTYNQALKAGATSVTRPTDVPWGDRVSRVRDPLGNIWWIMTRIENVDPKEIEKRMADKKYAEAMKYVQDAEFFPGK